MGEAEDLASILGTEIRLAERDIQEDLEPERHAYDLIVPVFNAPDVLAKCLDSLIANTDPRHGILVVDDASTDPRIEPMLAEYAARWPHLRCVRLPANLGFPGAVNAGLKMTRGDVVLINSDTEYSPGWLARMDRCRRSDPRIHVVCPLSNNATICSVPQFNAKNVLDGRTSIAEMARRVARTSLRRYPRIPTAVGFCMLVTREALERVGLLDTAFGKGYGEEVDWCQRAWAMGCETALCDDAYVYHHGEVTYSAVPEKRSLQEAAEKIVLHRWPGYLDAVRTYCLLNPLRLQHQRLHEASRARVAAAVPRVLHVCHSFDALAGTEIITRRVIEGTRGRVASTVLFPATLDGWYDAVTDEDADGLERIRMNRLLARSDTCVNGVTASIRSGIVERFFAEAVAGAAPDIVHFQHLIHFGSLLLPVIARSLRTRVVVSLHDYFLLCPEWNLTGPRGRPCGKPFGGADVECLACLARKQERSNGAHLLDLPSYLAERRALAGAALAAADRIIAPSESVRERFREAFGADIAGRIQVIPHGSVTHPREEREARSSRLVVAFLGYLNAPKGGDVFLEVVRRLKHSSICFQLVGACPDRRILLEHPNLEARGAYQAHELPRLLRDVDVVVIPSVASETYCLTLDEAFRAGVPVIASRVGAIPERLVHGRTGLLVEPGDPADLEAAIVRVERDRELLDRLRSEVSLLRLTSAEESIAEYEEIYRRLAARPDGKSDVIRARMRQNLGHLARLKTQGPS